MTRHFDAIVLGGGIIGGAIAEELARRGERIALIERGSIGQEASVAAAGILAAQMDLVTPGPFFDLCQASRRIYPQWVKDLERRSGLSLSFHVDGILYLAMTPHEVTTMQHRAHWQKRLGLRVERWSAQEVRRREPSVDGRVQCGFFFPTEAQVDNVVLMRALAIACRKAGVRLLERTTVRRLLVRHKAVAGVQTDQGTLSSSVVVNCLGSWASMGDRFPLRLPVEPVRGQMLAFLGPQRLFRHIVMSEPAYVVQRRDGRLIVGSTLERVGFNKSLTLEGMRAILSGLRRFTSALKSCPFLEAWAGFRPYTRDRLPILGKTPIEGLYVATGHFRHGILLAPITATLLAELILQGRAPFNLAPFSPQRFGP